MANFLYNRSVRVVLTDRDDPTDIITIENPKIDFQVEKQISIEPNRADIDIYNLSDDTASKINFRKPLFEFKFGRKVELFAGYKDGGLDLAKKIFSGVVISAITSAESPLKITRLECRNIFFELMQLPIKETAAKGELKADFIIKLLRKIGASVSPGDPAAGIKADQIAPLRARFNGETFADATNYSGTAYSVIDEISRGFFSKVNIYFDDIGVSFNPIGVPLNETPIIYDKETGLIGTPQPTEIGADFSVMLDPELKMSMPVILSSDTIQAFFQSGSNVLSQSGRLVVKKVIHAGSNRTDGSFETRASSVFER
jgi:hypothetical protein